MVMIFLLAVFAIVELKLWKCDVTVLILFGWSVACFPVVGLECRIVLLVVYFIYVVSLVPSFACDQVAFILLAW
jgi:hypothetical protein